ncbi:hypothetical protein O181_041144 [Austropuccinia psidii MF-1]|uniref:Uncharacterized protein n=1 Tax=Austropuccinia psidii MF-1 TaxID=1389203 RepID=A0A9Q3HG75_9BASI|nr:hypothetical protein [Austropuccinia psidii MF-1]
MTSPFHRDLGFPRNKPENLKRRKRRGREKLTSVSNSQQLTYNQGTPSQSPISDQNHPRGPIRVVDRCRMGYANPKTPERGVLMEYVHQNVQHGRLTVKNRNQNTEYLPQENYLAVSHGRDETLELQHEFRALRRKRKHNQQKPGSHKRHRKFLVYERAQSD